MKKYPALFFFILLIVSGRAQPVKFPDGVYYNCTQLKNLEPSRQADLLVSKRTSGDILMYGGYDYEIQTLSGTLTIKGNLRDDVYAYVRNDSVFLNGIQMTRTSGYTLCLTNGNYLAFRAGNIPGKSGIIGGAIGGLDATTDLYMLSVRSGAVCCLTKEILVNRLQKHKDLLQQFHSEKEKESDSILLKYIDLLNKVTPLSMPKQPTIYIDSTNLLPVKRFPPGLYFDIEQLKNQTPASQADLIVTKRTIEDIRKRKGNDYTLKAASEKDGITKKAIRNDIFAFVRNDSIFINGAKFQLHTGYALALTCGNYIAFKGCWPIDDADIAPNTRIINKNPETRYLYVLSLRPFSIRELNTSFLALILNTNENLLKQYEAEEVPSSESIMIGYVDVLNRMPKPN